MLKFNVPFVANPSGHCVPACIAMVVQYFRPELNFTLKDSDIICGFKEGLGTWTFKSMMELHDLGFDLAWIGDWSIERFSVDPEQYLKELFKDEEAFRYQILKSDILLEQRRALRYLGSGLPFEERQGSREDIEEFLNKGWLVRCEVNGAPLAGVRGYDAHSVLVIGYTQREIIIHNPDGKNGSMPSQRVEWSKFLESWRQFGGSMEMTAYKYDKNAHGIE
jgi:hypothetical protein